MVTYTQILMPIKIEGFFENKLRPNDVPHQAAPQLHHPPRRGDRPCPRHDTHPETGVLLVSLENILKKLRPCEVEAESFIRNQSHT